MPFRNAWKVETCNSLISTCGRYRIVRYEGEKHWEIEPGRPYRFGTRFNDLFGAIHCFDSDIAEQDAHDKDYYIRTPEDVRTFKEGHQAVVGMLTSIPAGISREGFSWIDLKTMTLHAARIIHYADKSIWRLSVNLIGSADYDDDYRAVGVQEPMQRFIKRSEQTLEYTFAASEAGSFLKWACSWIPKLGNEPIAIDYPSDSQAGDLHKDSNIWTLEARKVYDQLPRR